MVQSFSNENISENDMRTNEVQGAAQSVADIGEESQIIDLENVAPNVSSLKTFYPV